MEHPEYAILAIVAAAAAVAFVLHIRQEREKRREETILNYLDPGRPARLQAEAHQQAFERSVQITEFREQWAKGKINPAMICPHCHQKGGVRTIKASRKGGVSGTKAAAALITGGVSILLVGLAQVGKVTHASCDKCDNSWMF